MVRNLECSTSGQGRLKTGAWDKGGAERRSTPQKAVLPTDAGLCHPVPGTVTSTTLDAGTLESKAGPHLRLLAIWPGGKTIISLSPSILTHKGEMFRAPHRDLNRKIKPGRHVKPPVLHLNRGLF